MAPFIVRDWGIRESAEEFNPVLKIIENQIKLVETKSEEFNPHELKTKIKANLVDGGADGGSRGLTGCQGSKE